MVCVNAVNSSATQYCCDALKIVHVAASSDCDTACASTSTTDGGYYCEIILKFLSVFCRCTPVKLNVVLSCMVPKQAASI